jgi:hypothetical protein
MIERSRQKVTVKPGKSESPSVAGNVCDREIVVWWNAAEPKDRPLYVEFWVAVAVACATMAPSSRPAAGRHHPWVGRERPHQRPRRQRSHLRRKGQGHPARQDGPRSGLRGCRRRQPARGQRERPALRRRRQGLALRDRGHDALDGGAGTDKCQGGANAMAGDTAISCETVFRCPDRSSLRFFLYLFDYSGKGGTMWCIVYPCL